MVSRWGSDHHPDLPTLSALMPVLSEFSKDHFDIKLEAVSTAIRARSRKDKLVEIVGASLILSFALGGMWYTLGQPCIDNWDECSQLPWYKMAGYQMMKNQQALDEFKEYRRKAEAD